MTSASEKYRRSLAAAPAVAVLVSGFWVTVALFATFTGRDIYKELFPGAINMLPNTSLGMALCAASLLCLRQQRHRWATLWGRFFSCAAAVIGGGTVLEYTLGQSLGIDSLFLHLPFAIHIPERGLRMGFPTAAGLLLVSSGLLLQSHNVRRSQIWGHSFQLGACLLGWWGLVTPAFGVVEFYGLISYMRISVPASLCLMSLSAGAICARPGVGLARMALGAGLAGLMLRSLLPAVFILPFATSLLGWWGELASLYAPNYGDVLSTVGSSVLFIVLLFYCARAIETAETAQWAANQQLARSEARYRLLTEGTGDVVWVVDAQSLCFSYVSPAVWRVHGKNPDDLLGQPVEIMLLPGEWEQWRERALQRVEAVESGHVPPDQIFIEEVQTFGPDGLIWTEISVKLRKNQESGRLEFHGVTRDITDRKTNQLALEARERQLRELLEKSPIAMWLMGANGETTFVNDRFLSLTGYSAADIPSAASFLERAISSAGKRAVASGSWREFLEGTGPVPRYLPAHQLEIVSAAHEERIVEFSAIGGADYCLVSLVDLTEVVRSRRELQVANEMLEKRVRERTAQLEVSNSELLAAKQEADAANQAKSEFLSRMSHELRTPLNAILGFGQILSFHDLGARDNENVKYILQAGNHLLELINEILDISRIETGRMAMAPEQIDLALAVREALELMRPLAETQQVHLINELESPIPVFADPQRLRQILLNLIANAIKYNRPDGEVRLHLAETDQARDVAEGATARPGRISIAGAEGGSEGEAVPRVRLAVSDTGWGLTASDISRLFVPFERLAAARTSIEGTGIGLVLTQRLVQAMDGAIGVQSTHGQGSTFWVDLPSHASLVRPEGDLERPNAAPALGIGPLGRNERPQLAASKTATVMYVDDNPANVRLLRSALRKYSGVRLLETEQGSLALDLASQHHPAFMIIADKLADMTVNELLERLKRQPATAAIPVFLYGAKGQEASAPASDTAGPDPSGVLARPLNLMELDAIFHRYLAHD